LSVNSSFIYLFIFVKWCSFLTEIVVYFSIEIYINRKNIERYAKDLREKGMSHFFNRKETRGQCYKFTPEKMNQAQRLLDQGYSQYRTAKIVGVSESAIRYHIKANSLKKK